MVKVRRMRRKMERRVTTYSQRMFCILEAYNLRFILQARLHSKTDSSSPSHFVIHGGNYLQIG